MSRLRTILGLAMPIALVLLAQTLMSLINIALVGHLGDAAVAGIGIGMTLFSALMAGLFGVDAGVQALVARWTGAGESGCAASVLNDALAIAVVAGLLLAVVGYVVGPAVFGLVIADPAVAILGLSYLHAMLPALPILGASFAFSAYRNGTGAPRYSLAVVAIQLPCSAFFSHALVFGALGLPRLDAAGAGLGATLASLVACTAHAFLAWRLAPVPGFLHIRPSLAGIRRIVKIGLPVSVQQLTVQLGIAVQFAIVGRLGTSELAAMNVIQTMMLLAILPASGMGIAAATLVGASLGRGDIDDARGWGWQVAWIGALGIGAFSLIVLAAPRPVLALFIADATTIALAATPLAVLAAGMAIDAFGRILGFALRGAGATRLVTTLAFVLQWGVQLPLIWLIGFDLGYGLLGIAVVRLVLFVVEAVVTTLLWRHGYWSAPRR